MTVPSCILNLENRGQVRTQTVNILVPADQELAGVTDANCVDGCIRVAVSPERSAHTLPGEKPTSSYTSRTRSKHCSLHLLFYHSQGANEEWNETTIAAGGPVRHVVILLK